MPSRLPHPSNRILYGRASSPESYTDACATSAVLESPPMHERLTNPRPQPGVDLRGLDSALVHCMLREQRLLRGKINRLHQLIKTGRPYSKLLDIVSHEI